MLMLYGIYLQNLKSYRSDWLYVIQHVLLNLQLCCYAVVLSCFRMAVLFEKIVAVRDMLLCNTGVPLF